MMRSHGDQDRSHRDPGSHGIAWVGLPLSRTGVLVTHSALRFLVIVLLLLAVPAASGASDQLGKVAFSTSCSASVQADFDRAVALLHSFWLDAAGKAFAAVAQADAGCAMAHWGTAMVKLGNPLGSEERRVGKEWRSRWSPYH